MTVDHAKIVGKAHRLDILRALANAPDGLKFSYIHFHVVKQSGTDRILKELEAAELVRHSQRGDSYRISEAGRKALAAGEALLAIGART